MPIYEFVCPSCGKVFEELVSLSRADEGMACPHCGETKTRRNISACAPPSSSRGSSYGGLSSGGCSPRGSFG